MKLYVTGALVFLVAIGNSSLSFGENCKKAAEEAAISKEKKANKSEKLKAKNTEMLTDPGALKAYGIKADEDSFSTEVYDSKGAFVPYDIVVKKGNCKIVSVKATTL